MKKTLMIAAAALALSAGAASFNATPAQAGSKFHIQIGGYGHGYHGGHYGGCYYKWKKVRRKIWHYHGYSKHYHWKWVSRKVRICY